LKNIKINGIGIFRFCMKEEIIFNLSYFIPVFFSSCFLFSRLKGKKPEEFSNIVNKQSDTYFNIGFLIFIISLFIPDIFIQTIVVLISTGFLMFFLIAWLFLWIIKRFLFFKIDYRIYLISLIFYIALIYFVEHLRGVY